MSNQDEMAARLKELDRRAKRIGLLEAALNGLRRVHLVVEDCWYSCPKAIEADDPDGGSACCDDQQVEIGDCTCGADDHNARIDAALAPEEESE